MRRRVVLPADVPERSIGAEVGHSLGAQPQVDDILETTCPRGQPGAHARRLHPRQIAA